MKTSVLISLFLVLFVANAVLRVNGAMVFSDNFESTTPNSTPSGWNVNENNGNTPARVRQESTLSSLFGGGRFLEMTHSATVGYGHNVNVTVTNSGAGIGPVGEVRMSFAVPSTNSISRGFYQIRIGTDANNDGTAFALGIGTNATFSGLCRTDGTTDTQIPAGMGTHPLLPVQTNTRYDLRIVYNNSSDLVTYDNGRSLTANSADVYVNNAWKGLIQKSGAAATDSSLDNFNFCSKSDALGAFWVDDIVLSDVPYRPLEIFFDDFNSETIGSVPSQWISSEHSGNTTARVAQDTTNLFGLGTNNRYVNLAHSTVTGSGHCFYASQLNEGAGIGTVGRISFDVILPTSTLSPRFFKARCGTDQNNSGTTFAIGIAPDGFYALVGTSDASIPPTGTYHSPVTPTLVPNRVYEVSMVFNNSASTATYAAGMAVAANTMDLWVDGTRVASGIGKCGGPGTGTLSGTGIPTGTSITCLDFVSTSTTQGSLYVDNVEIASSPAIPSAVADRQTLQQMINVAQPGDTIVINGGTYNDYGALVFSGNGTNTRTITLKAASPGTVTFSGGMQLVMMGSYLNVRDILFSGVSNTAHAIAFDGCSYSKIENCVFDNTNFENLEYRDAEVICLKNYSHHNMITDNTFDRTHGQGIAVRVKDPTTGNTYNTIQYNLFRNTPPDNDVNGNPVNGSESIQIGSLLDHAFEPTYTTVYKNVFWKADGDNETISVKSSNNYIIDNLLQNCTGSITVRSATNCFIERNVLIACSASGVIRTYGSGHVVDHNYIDGWDTALGACVTPIGLRIEGGRLSGSTVYMNNDGNSYFNNTIINTAGYAIKMSTVSSTLTGTLAPLINNCRFYNNLMEMKQGGGLDCPLGTTTNSTWSANIANTLSATAFVGNSYGFLRGSTSSLITESTSVSGILMQRLGAGSTKAVNKGSSYSSALVTSSLSTLIVSDFEGEAVLDTTRDIGCDEFKSPTLLGPPLTKEEVGASWWSH